MLIAPLRGSGHGPAPYNPLEILMATTARSALLRAARGLRGRAALIRSQARDAGASATDWALILVAGGTLVGLVYAAANSKIGEKIAQIAGL